MSNALTRWHRLRIHRPANDPATECGEGGTQIQPAFAGTALGNIARPQLIWGKAMELAVDQIVGGEYAA